jgi:serine-type D-Ala-D-Ala carboxypeptidase (penicillin-binding protein 5/6)
MLSHRFLAAVLAGASLLLVGTVTPGLAVPSPAPAPVGPASAGPAPVAPAAAVPVGGPALTGGAVVVRSGRGVPAPPAVPVTSYVVADATTGEVLAAKAPHRRMRPASTLKTLTAVTLMPRLDPKATYVATREDENIEGTRVGLKAGQRYTVEQLWHGLLLSSGNDAANALANAAGGVPTTLRLMRDKARELQALDTLPSTTSGLDNDYGPGPFSSAYDLALIARAGMAQPEFRRYTSTRLFTFPAGGGKNYQIANMNRLLGSYEGAIGVKNGYTSKARFTFVGAATRGQHTIVVTLMSGDRDIQAEARRLLDWGFKARAKVTPVGRLVDPLPPAVPVDGASAVPAANPVPVAGQPHSAGAPGQGGAPIGAATTATVALLLVSGVTLWVRRRRGTLRPFGG